MRVDMANSTEQVVWKYEVPVDDKWHEVLVPSPAKVLHVDSQGKRSSVCIWIQVTPGSDENVPRRFRAFGTGQPVPSHQRSGYVGTAIELPFVWHVYSEYPGMFGKYGDELIG